MLINLVLPGDPHCISLAVSPVCLGAATCVGVHRSRAAVLTSQRGSGCLVTVPVWQIYVQLVTVPVWQSLSQCGSHCSSVADLCSVTVPVWQICVRSVIVPMRQLYVQSVIVPMWQSSVQSVTVPVWQMYVDCRLVGANTKLHPCITDLAYTRVLLTSLTPVYY